MIDLFMTGLALLGLWLSAVWDSLGLWGQTVLIIALLLIASGCIGTVIQGSVRWWQVRRAGPLAARPSLFPEWYSATDQAETVLEAYQAAWKPEERGEM